MKRITVEEALAHPYLEAYHNPDDESVAPPLDLGFFKFDRRYQPGAAQRSALRRDHVLLPCPNHLNANTRSPTLVHKPEDPDVILC
ncbi:hypothetical protein DFJ58DRAFT_825106 [Suillus subalutaceus]|uniref:uncharacterized protein n=1 Tax=Suillus subalutaceus TaxID=48586 RepID=UPI001B87A023|nr:uncharacterized protein DFJ58DRAFT_825106 [Suillus subalutaceus]KAG1830065.1 hypothetical protein DFJ58DRAFT_825106 [Suillus subalutaceus]